MMDKWTETSRQAQDYLFRRVDKDGYYIPHQAIYGFAPYRVLQFCEIQSLLSCLDKLDFDSFLDVGCAEGFYPRLVKVRYGAKSYGMDLSVPAIRRMWEYNHIEGVCGDAHKIPIKDKSFDVVLCNDMIEHVTKPFNVISELIRITKKHLFIGVPIAVFKSELREFKPDLNAERDQHVHIFTPATFRQILPQNDNINIHYSRTLPILILNAIYKRSFGKIGNFISLVKVLLGLDRNLSKLGIKKATHAFAHINLTEKGDLGSPKKYSSLIKFIINDIYRINQEELKAKPIYWGTDNCISWRQYLIKQSESPETRTSISDEVMSFLACPKCRSDVIMANNRILCQKCDAKYSFFDGVPIMFDE